MSDDLHENLMALQKACEDGSYEMVVDIFEKYPNIARESAQRKNQELNIAVTNGHIQIVNYLLDNYWIGGLFLGNTRVVFRLWNDWYFSLPEAKNAYAIKTASLCVISFLGSYVFSGKMMFMNAYNVFTTFEAVARGGNTEILGRLLKHKYVKKNILAYIGCNSFSTGAINIAIEQNNLNIARTLGTIVREYAPKDRISEKLGDTIVDLLREH